MSCGGERTTSSVSELRPAKPAAAGSFPPLGVPRRAALQTAPREPSPENCDCSMLDQLSRFTILKLSFKESMLEHQSGGKAAKRAGREAGSDRARFR